MADPGRRAATTPEASPGAAPPGLATATWSWGDPLVAGAVSLLGPGAPLVHCLTNIVVAGFTANVLLAVGASPAMVENARESSEFAAIAGAVLVNLGTLSAERDEAMVAAASSASHHAVPWVLDPVAVGALAHRTRLAAELVALRPTIVRGNASEVMSLAGAAGAGGRGVDSTAGSEQAVVAARDLARASGAVVAVSGAVDYVTDGRSTVAIPGGDPLLSRVTGTGCALGALMAALCACGRPPLEAAGAASALLGEAGSRAAAGSPGPGSFAVRLIDELAALAAAPGPAA
jgi:hydroxyethylthiazole kinase